MYNTLALLLLIGGGMIVLMQSFNKQNEKYNEKR